MRCSFPCRIVEKVLSKYDKNTLEVINVADCEQSGPPKNTDKVFMCATCSRTVRFSENFWRFALSDSDLLRVAKETAKENVVQLNVIKVPNSVGEVNDAHTTQLLSWPTPDIKIQMIGISGKMGVGKDYIVNEFLLNKGIPTLVLAYADFIKFDAIAKRGKTYEQVMITKDEETRGVLQRLGTELGRQIYGEFVWVNLVINTVRLHYERSGIKRFVFIDNRFPNEVDFIKQFGKIIRIKAPKRNHIKLLAESKGDITVYAKLAGHASETALDDMPDKNFDFVLNNDPEDSENTATQMNMFLAQL